MTGRMGKFWFHSLAVQLSAWPLLRSFFFKWNNRQRTEYSSRKKLNFFKNVGDQSRQCRGSSDISHYDLTTNYQFYIEWARTSYGAIGNILEHIHRSVLWLLWVNHFTWAESYANEGDQRPFLFSFAFDSAHVKYGVWPRPKYNKRKATNRVGHLILRALAIRASDPKNALARTSFHSPKS